MKGYYAAFVVDPLGNNIEIVYFGWILLRLYSFLSYVLPAPGAGNNVNLPTNAEMFGPVLKRVPHSVVSICNQLATNFRMKASMGLLMD